MPPSLLVRASQDPDIVIGALRAVIDDLHQHIERLGAWNDDSSDDGSDEARWRPGHPEEAHRSLASLVERHEVAGRTLGDALDDLRNVLLNHEWFRTAAGLAIWRRLSEQIFTSQQFDLDYEAISYAVMDGNNYPDLSSNVDVQSLEVFFDATDPMLIDFIDSLIEFEAGQETRGTVFVGYASLRFTGSTSALLGPQLWPLPCGVEVAGLADVNGSTGLVEHAERLAAAAAHHCMVHWGQRNRAAAADVEAQLAAWPHGGFNRLTRWREILSKFDARTGEGSFSSAFTRQVGLEPIPGNASRA